MFKVGDVVCVNDYFFINHGGGLSGMYKHVSFKITGFYDDGDVANLQDIKDNQKTYPFHISYLTLDINYYRKLKLKKLCSKLVI